MGVGQWNISWRHSTRGESLSTENLTRPPIVLTTPVNEAWHTLITPAHLALSQYLIGLRVFVVS